MSSSHEGIDHEKIDKSGAADFKVINQDHNFKRGAVAIFTFSFDMFIATHRSEIEAQITQHTTSD